VATLRDLLYDSIARDVYVERNRLEDRMEWREEFEDSVLLALQARKLCLNGLRRLAVCLEELRAEFIFDGSR
jgi:hypothetical protein